jgi:hypothetical protein
MLLCDSMSLTFTETIKLQTITKDDLESQDYSSADNCTAAEENKYYQITGGSFSERFIDTTRDQENRLKNFVNKYSNPNLRVLELFGPGVASNSPIIDRVRKATGLVKLEKGVHDKAGSKYKETDFKFVDCNIADLRELRSVLKSEDNFDLIIGDPVGILHSNRYSIPPEQFYAGVYLYLSTIYSKLDKRGAFMFPNLKYNQLGRYDQDMSADNLQSRNYRSRVAKLISGQYFNSDIKFTLERDSICLKKGKNAPSQLPKVSIEEILKIHNSCAQK